MKKKKIYISGPITNHDLEERRSAFSAVEAVLNDMGFEVVNPMKNGLPEDSTYERHMRADIGLLISCDFIYLMHGMEDSKGSNIELFVARHVGIKIIAMSKCDEDDTFTKEKVLFLFKVNNQPNDNAQQ